MCTVRIGGGFRTGRGQANHTSPGNGGRPHWRGKPGCAVLPGRLCLSWKQKWCRQVRTPFWPATWALRMDQDCTTYSEGAAPDRPAMLSCAACLPLAASNYKSMQMGVPCCRAIVDRARAQSHAAHQGPTRGCILFECLLGTWLSLHGEAGPLPCTGLSRFG